MSVLIPISQLRRRHDARRIDPAVVSMLAKSIADIGVLNPLTVRPAKISVAGQDQDGYEISAGVHRYEAASRCGLDEVPCNIIADDDLRAELAMIDENLCRAELGPSDRAAQTARRKEIYEELHPETRAGVAGGRARQGSANENSSFADTTADAIGKTRRAVEIDAARGKALAADLTDIAGTSLDKGVELDALAKMGVGDRKDLIARAKSGETVSARKPAKIADDPLNDFEANEKQVAGLMAAWNRASPEAREEFLCRIDRPIMDAKYGSAA